MILLHIKYILMMKIKKEEVSNPLKETKAAGIYEFIDLKICLVKFNYQNFKSMSSKIIQKFIKNP